MASSAPPSSEKAYHLCFFSETIAVWMRCRLGHKLTLVVGGMNESEKRRARTQNQFFEHQSGT